MAADQAGPSQYELTPAPTDAISSVHFAPSSSKLLVSSWDRHVYLYDALGTADAQLVSKHEQRAPVLGACFGEDEHVAYTAGLDGDVRRLDLETREQTVLSNHSTGANAVAYSAAHGLLFSTSWDGTLHVHHKPGSSDPPSTLRLPAKPFALALTDSKLVVAMAGRLLHVYELSAFAAVAGEAGPEIEPLQRRDSSLKFMTRALAAIPDGSGYASSSIEGRVAVDFFDPSEKGQARKYAFKCHRLKMDDGSGGDVVYPVHAVAFHPTNGLFVTGGGDGTVAMWDSENRRRVKHYKNFPAGVAGLDFSRDGRMLAVVTSPGFEEGREDIDEGTVKVFIRTVSGDEAADEKKSKKAKKTAA